MKTKAKILYSLFVKSLQMSKQRKQNPPKTKNPSGTITFLRLKKKEKKEIIGGFRVYALLALVQQRAPLGRFLMLMASFASKRVESSAWFGCERRRPVSTSRSKMAVSVFPGVRLLSIGDANGDIQRHSEQQPLRLEVKSTQDAALINLSNGEFWTFIAGLRSPGLV